MSFKLVYLSQQDPQWKNDLLGFGDPGDTIGYVGCALTATAMLLSGHGYTETPKTLNQKLKNVNGFASAGIVWSAVTKLYPNVSLKAFIPCSTSDAPLAQIDAAIAAGQPAIVQVDSSPATGIQTHWVVLYARKGDDYLMLDPWPYNPGTDKEDYLMKRYAQGRTLQRAISHVILFEAYGSGGPISTPSSSTTSTTPPSTPTTGSTTSSGAYARVRADVTWGLNVRSSIDTSSMANVVDTVTAGAELLLLELDGLSRVGGVNQWVRVRTPDGKEGFCAAWYLEKVSVETKPVETTPVSSPSNEAPVSSPTPSTPVTPSPVPSTPVPSTPSPSAPKKLIVKVSSTVGSSGLRMRKYPSLGGALVMSIKAGTKLTVVEPEEKAKTKIGVANKWIYVRELGGKLGYVAANYVSVV
ncbi:MAG: SH3 domain-containing protein [Anaerolineales bacterium]|nr:SH3 domain-containing protein [Anaerolineales bacterium]